MSAITRKSQHALMHCAPFSEKHLPDRAMRLAVFTARKNRKTAPAFAHQQAFDAAIAARVQAIPVPPETAEWFVNEKLVATAKKRGWKRTARHPAIVASVFAFAVIIGIAVHMFMERLNEFPGSGSARKLLTVASTTHVSQLASLQTDAGELGDLFFMKYRLEHYEVPPEFAHLRTIGYRVFDDEEGQQVAQIEVGEKRMQLFLFPAGKDKNGNDAVFSGWRYVEQEGWIGVVEDRQGVCFMAAVRGRKRDLSAYLAKKSE